jgi:hypothetical protein
MNEFQICVLVQVDLQVAELQGKRRMHKKYDSYECGRLVRVCKYQICVWYIQVELQVAGIETNKTELYEFGRLVRVGKYAYK